MNLPFNFTALYFPSTIQIYRDSILFFEFPIPYNSADLQLAFDFYLQLNMKKEILNYMVRIAPTCVCLATGDVNTTSLAELAADKFNLDSALDDETHYIWELALEAERVYGK